MNTVKLPELSPVETQVYETISSYEEFQSINEAVMNNPVVYADLLSDEESYPLYQKICWVIIIQQRVEGETWEDHEPVGIHMNAVVARNTLLQTSYDDSVRDAAATAKAKNVLGGMT